MKLKPLEVAMDLSKCQILGAMVPPRGAGAFDRGNVVVTTEDGTIAELRGFLGEGFPLSSVQASWLTVDDWQGLVRSEQAISIIAPAVPMRYRRMGFWVLRGAFWRERATPIDDLGAWQLARFELSDGIGLLVHESAATNKIRDRCADLAWEAAEHCAKGGLWTEAYEHAVRGSLVGRGLTPAYGMALVALTTAMAVNPGRSIALISAERQRVFHAAQQAAEQWAASKARLKAINAANAEARACRVAKEKGDEA